MAPPSKPTLPFGIGAANAYGLRLLAIAPLLVAAGSARSGLALTFAAALVIAASAMLRVGLAALPDSVPRAELGLLGIAFSVAVTDQLLQAYLPGTYAGIAGTLPLLPLLALVGSTICLVDGITNSGDEVQVHERDNKISWILQSVALTFLPFLFGALRELLAHGGLFGATATTNGAVGLPSWLAFGRPVDGLLIAARSPFVWFFMALLLASCQALRRASPVAGRGGIA